MKTKKVLIVDDEDDIREVAQMSLELVGGWEVLAASSGDVAARTAAVEQPDVILLDVMMPGLDGPQTLQLLRTDPETADIPVIFLTAKVQTSERRLLHDLGVQGLISKPFDPMTLADQVDQLLAVVG
jgi:CheY-like chemotaxis protein